MKKLLLLLMLACLGIVEVGSRAQASTIGPLSCLPASFIPPQIVVCTAPYTGGAAIVGGTFTLSQPLSAMAITPVGTALTAVKSITAAANSFVLWGPNQNVIPDGTILSASFNIPVGTPAGTLTPGFTNVVMADASGTGLVTTVNPSTPVTVLPSAATLPVIQTSSLSNGVVGTPYPATTLTATGTGAMIWSGTPCAPGLSLSSTGVLSGTPTAALTCSFTATVRDTVGSSSKSFSLTIAPAPSTFSPCDLNKSGGAVDVNDVILAVQDWLASPKIPIFGTVAPTVGDVQLIINAENGACLTTPPPPPPTTATLSLFVCPASMLSSGSNNCSVSLSAGAPVGGAIVSLSTGGCDPAAFVPASVTVPAGAVQATAPVTMRTGFTARQCTFSAGYNGVTKSVTVLVGP